MTTPSTKPKKRRSLYTPGEYQLRVGKSRTGKGLFALEDIPKDVCIIEYIGKPISEEDAIKSNGRYLFEVAKNKTIDGNIPENTARYINHSCKGNCEAIGPRGHIYIFSKKRIKAGEELTYDYGKDYFDRYLKPHGCRCTSCMPA